MPFDDVTFRENSIKHEFKEHIQNRHKFGVDAVYEGPEKLAFVAYKRDIYWVANCLKYTGFLEDVMNANKNTHPINRPTMELMWCHLVKSKIGWYREIANRVETVEDGMTLAIQGADGLFGRDKEEFMIKCFDQVLGGRDDAVDIEMWWRRQALEASQTHGVFTAEFVRSQYREKKQTQRMMVEGRNREDNNDKYETVVEDMQGLEIEDVAMEDIQDVNGSP